MLDNVVWNASGVVVKGDQHTVSGNTIFDAADITENSAVSPPLPPPSFSPHPSSWVVVRLCLYPPLAWCCPHSSSMQTLPIPFQ